jgi:hypothetical protein
MLTDGFGSRRDVLLGRHGYSTAARIARMSNVGPFENRNAMTNTATDEPLSNDLRRAIFLALVESQDAGASVEVSHKAIALRFDVTLQQVKAIEREGLDGNWPPLGG